jgi:hypothetical protein
VGSPHSWLWTFTNPDFTLYQVTTARRREVIQSVIGPEYQGVVVSDCLSVYDGVCENQQKCLAHHLKAIRLALEQAPTNEYLLDWQGVLKQAIELKKQKPVLSEQLYWNKVIALILEATTLLTKPSNQTQGCSY